MQKQFIPLWLIVVTLFTSASAQQRKADKPEPLMIQEQGSFAVGGTVTTTPGTFDPVKQGAFNPASVDPAGQTLHADHAYVSIRSPQMPEGFHSSFGTATGSRLRHGRPRRMDVRDFKTSSCAADFRSI